MPATQDFVKIEAIRDDVVLLRGGAMRALLRVSSINFALKSEDEQTAIIYSFQSLLNSLDFEIQIFINARFLNVDDYIATIQEVAQKQTNELLRVQAQEYEKFIKDFVQEAQIISTDFFVVIPFSVQEGEGTKNQGFLEKLGGTFGIGAAGTPREMDPALFAHYRGQLTQRVDFVGAGLQRMGLMTKQLNTEELIGFFWNLYNPQGLKKRALMKPLLDKY